jgi:septal ring factor EnvC (AmiA/AmiB activator)
MVRLSLLSLPISNMDCRSGLAEDDPRCWLIRTRSRRSGCFPTILPWLPRLTPPPSEYQKLASLRAEADANAQRAEDAEAKVKRLEQDALQREQEIQSLQHKLTNLEADLDKSESKLAEAKVAHEEGRVHAESNEGLQRKIQLLEGELDIAEKNLRDTTEK